MITGTQIIKSSPGLRDAPLTFDRFGFREHPSIVLPLAYERHRSHPAFIGRLELYVEPKVRVYSRTMPRFWRSLISASIW